MYNIDFDTLDDMLKEIKINPDAYAVKQDQSFSEDESYSEKSQEFELEKKGEYLGQVFEEDKTIYREMEAITRRKDYDPLMTTEQKDKRKTLGVGVALLSAAKMGSNRSIAVRRTNNSSSHRQSILFNSSVFVGDEGSLADNSMMMADPNYQERLKIHKNVTKLEK